MSEHVIEFDEPSHTYRLNGVAVPSVTTVIGAVWTELWDWCNDFAKERGRVVHKAVHYAIKGTLDWDSIDPFLTGYVTAATRALRDLKIDVEHSESRVYSVAYQYAGTLDVLGERNGKRIMLDWKTGDPGLACGLQLAAYVAARTEMTGEVIRERLGIWLHEDSTYDVRAYTDRNDLNYFLAARTVYGWPGGKISKRNATEERNAA